MSKYKCSQCSKEHGSPPEAIFCCDKDRRIEELVAQKKHWIGEATKHTKMCLKLEQQLAELKPYIKHRMMCARNRAPIRPHSHPDGLLRQACDCGLDAILKREKGE